MEVLIKRTSGVHAAGIKTLVYGQPGTGKTRLCATLPNPIILSAESGLLSLAEFDLPYIEINSMASLIDAYQWVKESPEANEYESIAIDSISEIAEVVLAHEKKQTKDGRKAYSEMNDQMAHIIRSFRDIYGKNVYLSAKVTQQQDEIGQVLYYPMMPGKATGTNMPYFFDQVMAMRVEKDTEGKTHHFLQCKPDGLWIAKDRSNVLDMYEPADFNVIFDKILRKTDAA